MLTSAQAFALVFENKYAILGDPINLRHSLTSFVLLSHGFNQWQVGLTFLGIFVGMVRFSSLLCAFETSDVLNQVIGVLCDPISGKACAYQDKRAIFGF